MSTKCERSKHDPLDPTHECPRLSFALSPPAAMLKEAAATTIEGKVVELLLFILRRERAVDGRRGCLKPIVLVTSGVLTGSQQLQLARDGGTTLAPSAAPLGLCKSTILYFWSLGPAEVQKVQS